MFLEDEPVRTDSPLDREVQKGMGYLFSCCSEMKKCCKKFKKAKRCKKCPANKR